MVWGGTWTNGAGSPYARRMSRWSLNLLFLSLALVFTGCDPGLLSQADEERDPHYLAGQERARAADIQGASEEFEAALENNPKSGAAHLELGLIQEQKKQDFAEAIYHYQRFLRLRPKSPQADNIRERIRACKSDLARTEVIAPVTASLQRDLEGMTTDNVQLRGQVDMLLRQVQDLEAQLRSRPALQPLPRPTGIVDNGVPQADEQTPTPRGETAPVQPRAPAPRPAANPVAQARTHKVVAGETIAQIAKKYRVPVQSIVRANPGVRPERLKIGQSLAIPAQ